MKKVLVTGGAGYVGSAMIPLLLERGYQVRVLDNLMYGGEPLLGNFRYPGFEVVVGDIRDKEKVKECLKGVDAIVHLAAIVGFPACKKAPDLAKEVNVGGTRLIDELRSKDQMFVQASTGSNYGDIEVDVCTEETPLKPLTEYGRTKTEAEQMLLDGGNVVVYRFATAFGLAPRLRLDLLVNDFVYQAVKNRNLIIYEKQFMRSFIDVQDMALSMIFAVEHYDKMRGQVFNVGDESMNFTKEDVAKRVQQYVKYYLHFAEIGEDLDKRNYYVSYDKINALGFKTTVNLDDGIKRLIGGVSLVTVHNPYSNV